MTVIDVPPAAHLRHAHPDGLGGLIALVEGVEAAFPLTEVRVRTEILGDCARTIVQQRFENPFDQPLEAVHIFPLPHDGVVVALTLKAGEVVVQGECKEKGQAEKEFAQAREAGHRAALVVQERDDVHTVRVTRIPPGEAVTVELEVVERLERADGQFRWRFPTVVAPRYLPGQPISHGGDGVLPATDRVPDADRLQPPLRLQGGTRLDLEVHIQGPVRTVSSALHAVRMELEDGIRIAPSASATLDRDFVLSFDTAAPDRMISRAWTDGSHTLLTIEPPAVAMPDALPRDAIFVVDISGSMDGSKLVAAKRALRAAIRGLEDGDRFRVIAFDDRVEPMSPDLLPFSAATLERADAFIDGLYARGGTEMLPAIQEALKGDRPAGRARSVLFITDGQAWNEAELTAAVANRRQGARFFTFGIDTAVNDSLLTRLARVGGGTCELATPRDDIEEALANLEARFGSPVLEQVRVDGLTHASVDPMPLFTGRPATMMLEGAPDTLTVRGVGADGEIGFQVTPKRTGFALGALWARARVMALQDRLMLKPFEEEALRPEIIRIALAHGIASRFTAFIAVDRSRIVDGELRQVVQPAEKPADWAMPAGAPMPQAAGAMPPPAPMASRGAAAPRMMKKRARRRSGGGGLFGAAKEMLDGIGNLMNAGEPSKASQKLFDDLMKGGPARRDREAQLDGMMSMDEPELAEAPEPAAEGAFGFDEDLDDEFEAPPPMPSPVRKADLGYGGGGAPSDDWESELALSQAADGSFGGDVERTVAALLALLLAGHTRRRGSRRRVVAKAAAWLAGRTEALAIQALAALEQAERDGSLVADPAWEPLTKAGREGQALQAAMA